MTAARPPRLRIVVQKACRAPGVPPAATIRRWVVAAVGDRLAGEMTVRIINEAESADLNGRYRNRQGATNVLAFAADGTAMVAEGADSGLLPAGDLAICAQVIEREAAEQRKPLAEHWAHVVMHGALHLAGYDHETPVQARIMEGRERELLAELGIPDPYV